MNVTLSRLKSLLKDGETFLAECSVDAISNKPAPGKWSKKEILGHLIDSAINNLQRFTEIQFEPKPYTIREYEQDELVAANSYQNAELDDLTDLWLSINSQIIHVLGKQSDEILAYKVILSNGEHKDVRWVVIDYVDHLEHHLKQIIE